jgi:hypothetical protein
MKPNNGLFQIGAFIDTVELALEYLPTYAKECDPGMKVQVWSIKKTSYDKQAVIVFFSVNGENTRDSLGLDKGLEFIYLAKEVGSGLPVADKQTGEKT